MQRSGLPPLALYVHLPWCVRKCPYCDFNSHTAGGEVPKERYLHALLEDLEAEAASGRAAGRPLDTIFFGGGTPSLFSAEQIGRILRAAEQSFAVSDGAEVTLEANPGTVEHGKLADYRAAGITRLSLGAQSFHEQSLLRLGRIHGPDEIVAAYREARSAGFDSINIDLMFALPGQDVDDALDDLQTAIELSPPHISWYQLTLEPNTVFFAQPPPDLPSGDLAWEIQQRGHELLRESGYEQYEISAFARQQHRCRHNLNYWTFGDYFGIGAGAHGKISDAHGRIRRYARPGHPLSYIEWAGCQGAAADSAPLSDADVSFEFMLNALRLPDGFKESTFSERTGMPFSDVSATVEAARAKGLLEKSPQGRWRPTALGLRFLNDLQAGFLVQD